MLKARSVVFFDLSPTGRYRRGKCPSRWNKRQDLWAGAETAGAVSGWVDGAAWTGLSLGLSAGFGVVEEFCAVEKFLKDM